MSEDSGSVGGALPETSALEEAPAGAQAASPAPSDRRGWALLGGSVLLYLLLFAWFFPPTHGIEDEVGFLNIASIWARGALTVEGAGLEALSECEPGPRGHVGWRNVGRPLVTAPFLALGGYRAAFWAGALIHAALALVVALALRRMGRSAAWALLVLWHPTLVLYSRGIMADELGALGLACAAWGLLSRRWVLAGLALGGAVAARYHLGATIPVVLIFVALSCGRAALLRVAAGGACVAAGLCTYNWLYLGSPLGATGQGHFALAYLPENLPLFTLALLLMWPGMLLGPPLWALWRWQRRHEHLAPEIDRRAMILGALCLPLSALLCVYYFHDVRPSYLETLVVGQRLLAPALPAWVLIYAQVLSAELPGDLFGAARRRAWLAALAPLVAVAGCLGGGLLVHRHQRYLDDLCASRDLVCAQIPAGALVLANRHLSKLLEVPRPELPSYRLPRYEHHQRILSSAIEASRREPTYLVHLRRRAGEALPPAWLELRAAHPEARTLLETERILILRTPGPAPRAGGAR